LISRKKKEIVRQPGNLMLERPAYRKEVTVTCVKNGFQKALGDTSMPEIKDDEESTSENELNDVPEEIINTLHSFDCDSDEDFLGFE
jgi:hypothetical protein